MTAATIGRFAGKALLGLVAVCAVLAMVGCKNERTLEAEAQAMQPPVYRDPDTGCEYFVRRDSRVPVTPRIAADGKTHMGCSLAGRQHE